MPPGRKGTSGSSKIAEAPLTEYEKLRARTLMRNSQALQRLGVTAATSIFSMASAKKNQQRQEHSGSLYEGDESEESEHEEEISKVSMSAPKKKINHDSSTTARGPRSSSKRVQAPDPQGQPSRVTRQRTRDLPTADEYLNGLILPPQEVPNLNMSATTCNDLITPPSPTHHEQINISDEGAITLSTQQAHRGVTMGKDLERISRGLCAKVAINISEGKRRPEAPMQAAKLASEGGIALRHHIPILPHWKEYKKDTSHIRQYMDRIANKLDIDTDNKDVVHVCTDMLKGGQRQMRYNLKKKYFNGVPANQVPTTSPVSSMTDDQWRVLVEMWSGSVHKEKCMKNKHIRGKVRYQQRTGSRCYIAQAHVLKQEKFKDTDPTAIDLFKAMHCSKRVGFTEPVMNAIAKMEGIVADSAVDGQQMKSPTEAVSQVLPSSTFLRNVGLLSASKTSSRGGISSQVEDLKSRLEIEMHEKAELRQELETMKIQVQHSEQRMSQQAEEMAELKKTSQEIHAFLRQVMGTNKDR